MMFDNTPAEWLTQLSVIAVQGLGVHSYYTWIKKQNLAKKTKFKYQQSFNLLPGRWKNAQTDRFLKTAQTAFNIIEIMWFWDFLSTFISHARIATYSYEPNWWKAEMKTSLRKCDKQLFNVLHQNRSNKKVNKIVLSIHSFLLRIRQERRRPLMFIKHSLGGLIIKQVDMVSIVGPVLFALKFS